MIISGKAQHALATMILLARQDGWLAGPAIARQLDVSKVYLEQILSLLKRAELVQSKKGSQGGYKLKHPPEQTTVAAVLQVAEPRLFSQAAPASLEPVYQIIQQRIVQHMQTNIKILLSQLSLAELAEDCTRLQNNSANMFFI